MALAVLITGESGKGKTRSFKTLPPEETFLIRCIDKPLSWRGSMASYNEATKENIETNGNMCTTPDATKIESVLDYALKSDRFKYIILDDLQYVMADEYFERAGETGYKKYDDIGQKMVRLIKKVTTAKTNKVVFVTFHPEISVDISGAQIIKVKTIGKMVDDKLNIEGMFTINLFANYDPMLDGNKYHFVTNTRGNDRFKSPEGMFDLIEPNDALHIANKIKEYYGVK